MKSPILYFCATAILAATLYSCRCPNEEKSPFVKSDSASGYNLFLGDGVTAESVIAQIEAKFTIDIKTEEVRACPCGDKLININHPGLVFQGSAPVQVTLPATGSGATTQLDNVLSSINYEFSSDESGRNYIDSTDGAWQKELTTVGNMIKDQGSKTQLVKLAIFDSGFEKDAASTSYLGIPAPIANSCVTNLFLGATPATVEGFNFALKDKPGINTPINDGFYDIKDTHKFRHGTRVASIALRQFVKSKIRPNLLIMRVLNNENKGESFGIFCAMISAKQLGAQIFNMSLGYYGSLDSVFLQTVNSLNDIPSKPIWLIAAAGNSVTGKDVGTNYESPENRDLVKRPYGSKFYPAYFSDTTDNNYVVAVTTAYDGLSSICKGQNYGDRVVDLAVQSQNCTVYGGLQAQQSSLLSATAIDQGTSFAAPVVAGWIGANIMLTSSKSSAMLATGTTETLKPFVRNGRYIKDSRIIP